MNRRSLDRRYRLTPEMERQIWAMRVDDQMSQEAIVYELGGIVSQSTISRCLTRLIHEYNTNKEI